MVWGLEGGLGFRGFRASETSEKGLGLRVWGLEG